MTKKPLASQELRQITDAIDESILDASPDQLREELADEGLNEAKVVAEMDAILADAKKFSGKLRLEQAKEAVAAYKSQGSIVSPLDRDRVRKKREAMRSGAGENAAGMMMAARKGNKLSDSDEAGALDDLIQLEALENDENDGDCDE
jgi:hypothetical protein